MIVGQGIYDDGSGGLIEGAFLLDASSLTGAPEPSNLALLVLAIPALLRLRSRRRRTLRRSNHGHTARRPRFETLEHRALLAITVNTLTDELDGSIADGDVSLRDAIAAAPVGEAINFSVTGAINLTLGQLTIGQNLTVIGPGANQLTIDAGGASRVLEIGGAAVSVSGLTLTGGNASPDVGGDGGGGVFNRGNATLTGVAIQGNTADHFGGGTSNSGTLTIADSTIRGNSAPSGGGVYNVGSLTIKNSTISGNLASAGGGVHSYWYTSTTISNCTISGNTAYISGGGIEIWHESNARLSHTLITDNSAPQGSEIHVARGFGAVVHLNAFNLIGDSSKTTAQALDGVTAGATDILATSNGMNPTALAAILGPLANNGGPTMTHALVPGSPAINMGNPSFVGPPNFDQRGAPFVRVADFRLDIGAFETQTAGPALLGDYNQNSVVDAADYVVWRKMLNQPVAPYSGADGDGDGTVHQDDYVVWQEHFGQMAPPPAAGSVDSAAAESALSGPQVSDAKLAVRARGASENQRAKMMRESAIVDLAAPLARSRAEFRRTDPTSSAATASMQESRRDSALLIWLLQADSEPAPWPKGKMVEFDQTVDAGDTVLEPVDEVFAQDICNWTAASPINSTAW
jgi:hypothetical protein